MLEEEQMHMITYTLKNYRLATYLIINWMSKMNKQ